MFDIGWSEFVVIAVVALIAIGPKELPGVLRMVGQWVGKARRMASEFQGQFQEAMREAEMADLRKSFDEVKEAASGLSHGNLMTPLQTDVAKALQIEKLDPPASPDRTASGASTGSESRVTETDASHAQTPASEPLAIVEAVEPQPDPQASPPIVDAPLKDARAS